MEKKDKLLPVSIVAERLGVSTQSVYNLIVAADILAVWIGPRAGIRIYESELERFLSERKEQMGIEPKFLQEIS